MSKRQCCPQNPLWRKRAPASSGFQVFQLSVSITVLNDKLPPFPVTSYVCARDQLEEKMWDYGTPSPRESTLGSPQKGPREQATSLTSDDGLTEWNPACLCAILIILRLPTSRKMLTASQPRRWQLTQK